MLEWALFSGVKAAFYRIMEIQPWRKLQSHGQTSITGNDASAPTTRPSVASCRTCNTAVSGWKAKTAGFVCVSNAALRTVDKVGIDVVLADLRARGEL